MIKTTRAQREALFKVFKRDFPRWVSPTLRRQYNTAGHCYEQLTTVSSLPFKRFRKRVQPGPGCIMIEWSGMWLGIEPDGYTHS